MQQTLKEEKRASGISPTGTPAASRLRANAGEANGTSAIVASEGIDRTLHAAMKLAGVATLAEFQKLPKAEKNAFIAAATGAPKAEGADAGVKNIGLTLIDRSPFNRNHFNPERSQQLIESVREHGVLQPGLARPHPTKPGRFELVAGERRWNAAKVAGLATMPLKVRELTDEQAIELQAIENLHREDLNPVDEAVKYQQLAECYEKRGLKPTEAIEKIHQTLQVSTSTIWERLRLLKLPDEAKEAVLSGRLPSSHAALIAKLEKNREAQRAVTARILQPKKNEAADGDEPGTPLTIMSFRETKQLVEATEQQLQNQSEWNKLRDEYAAKGYLVLSQSDNAKVFTYPGNPTATSYNCGYVKPEEYCSEFQADTWKKACGKHAPDPILGQGHDGTPVILYAKTEAHAAAQKNQPRSAKRVSSRPESEVRREREHKVRTTLYNVTMHDIARNGESLSGEAEKLWRMIFEFVAERVGNDAARRVRKRRGLELRKNERESDAIERALQGATAKQLRGATCELIAAWHAPSQHSSGWMAGAKKMAEAMGATLPDWKVQTSGVTERLMASPKSNGKLTPEGRAKLAASMKARWAARMKRGKSLCR